MTNPIADPLVETVDSDAASPLAHIEATQQGVVTVWINRPSRRNALDPLTIAALRQAFETLHGAEGVRIVFLRGAGGQFSAGGDLDWAREAASLPEDDDRAEAHDMAAMLKALAEVPALTVALVEGEALGGGAGLVAACDMAVAIQTATFGFPEVTAGLLPAVISPYVIAAVGARTARRLFVTGRGFDAREAARIGLVDEIVADAAALQAAAARLAEEIMAAAPAAAAAAKRLVAEVSGRTIDHGLMHETARRAAEARESEEAQEAASARAAGRKPAWTSL